MPDCDCVRPNETGQPSAVAGESHELLLFDWLNELLYTYETRHLLLAQFDVTVTEAGVAATARGEPHRPRAASYWIMKSRRSPITA